MSDEAGEKVFDATPHRREEFRKQGRYARARDASAVAATAAVIGVLTGSRATIGRAIDVLFAGTLGDVGAIEHHDFGRVAQLALGTLAALAAPAAVAAAIAGTVVTCAQAGLYFEFDLISFKPERLNPFPKLEQLVSFKHGAVEAILSLLRIVVVAYVAYRALLIEIPDLLNLTRAGVEMSIDRMTSAIVRVVLSVLGALGLIAAADYWQSRFSLEKEMRMTREEMKNEMRQQDGDPKAKARMRQRQRQLARKRSIGSVKTADVVVANPTHISVALRYGEKDFAPIVIAKGHDEVALQIRTEARKYGIPILENRPLARALDAEVKIGHPIPAAHFTAVARVLAFVYKLRGGRRRGTARA